MPPLTSLTPTQRDEYEALLRTGYLMRCIVELLDTDGSVTAKLQSEEGEEAAPGQVALLGGEVQMDLDSDITRQCHLEIADPGGKINYARRGAHDYAMYVGRMVGVTYGVYLPVAGIWCDVPVFTGPVTQFDRNGAQVSIDASGKEWFLLDPFVKWNSRHWKAGALTVEVMLNLLRDQGENRFRGFPANPTTRLQKPFSVARWEQPWPVLRRLAQLANNRLIYYSGDGYCVLRSKATGVSWEFQQGRDVLGDAGFTWDFEKLRNTVVVQWTVGDHRQSPWIAVIGKDQPLGAETLQRNGNPLRMANLVDSQLHKSPQVKDLAHDTLARASITPVEVAFTALPVPHLEEYMRCAIVWDDIRTQFTLRSFSLGLTPGATMSVNVASNQIRTTERTS